MRTLAAILLFAFLLTWSRNKGELGITGAWQGHNEPLLNCSAGLV